MHLGAAVTRLLANGRKVAANSVYPLWAAMAVPSSPSACEGRLCAVRPAGQGQWVQVRAPYDWLHVLKCMCYNLQGKAALQVICH
jgi:hypothetical protein